MIVRARAGLPTRGDLTLLATWDAPGGGDTDEDIEKGLKPGGGTPVDLAVLGAGDIGYSWARECRRRHQGRRPLTQLQIAFSWRVVRAPLFMRVCHIGLDEHQHGVLARDPVLERIVEDGGARSFLH